jgi:catechol 2,3-dioxygenase-like lactoylglutathione lyase family enzyme
VTARRLQHASVQVPAALLPQAAAFYRDVLGLRPVPNLAGVAWFELDGGDQVHLMEGEGGAGTSAHFALQVDDLPATVARARAAGAAPTPGRPAWGEERWFVRDPAGNLVELFAVPPPRNPA